MWRRLGLVGAACLLGGAGIVSDGESTSLPVSPTAGMPMMTPTSGDQMAWAPDDAGMLWLPSEFVTGDGAPADAGPRREAGPAVDAGPPGPCAELEAQMEHRRQFLSGVWIKGTQVEAGMDTQAYCEQHLADVECSRPPTIAERDISEAIDDGSEEGVEVDPWLIRWGHELKECLATHAKPQPVAKPTSKPPSSATH